MKLIRFRKDGSVKPGILDDEGNIREASSIINDWTSQTVKLENLTKLNEIDMSILPIVSDTVSIAPCVGEVGKFICIGLNYSDHAAETGMEAPKEPIIFMKATSAICGSNDNIISFLPLETKNPLTKLLTSTILILFSPSTLHP